MSKVRSGQTRWSGDLCQRRSQIVVVGPAPTDAAVASWLLVDLATGEELGPVPGDVVQEDFPIVHHDPEVIAFMDRHPEVRRELVSAWGYVPGCYPEEPLWDLDTADTYWSTFAERGSAPALSSWRLGGWPALSQLSRGLARMWRAFVRGDQVEVDAARSSARRSVKDLRGTPHYTGHGRFALGCILDALTFTPVGEVSAAGVERMRGCVQRVSGGSVTADLVADLRAGLAVAGFRVRPPA